MRSKRYIKFSEAPTNPEELKKLKHKFQAAYLRKRLSAIEMLWAGQSPTQVCAYLHITLETLGRWIDAYNENGLQALVRPISRKQPQYLNPAQKEELRDLILKTSPKEHQIEGHSWNESTLRLLLETKYEVQLKKTRIYEILHELGLSYQRQHQDYAEANSAAQQAFVWDLKKK